MSESLATVLKLAVAAVLIVALIAGGKWALDKFNTQSGKVTEDDIGEFKPG